MSHPSKQSLEQFGICVHARSGLSAIINFDVYEIVWGKQDRIPVYHLHLHLLDETLESPIIHMLYRGILKKGRSDVGKITEELLCKGYFPKELPPSFTTVSFANFISNIQLSNNFRHNEPTKCVLHNLARPGTARRRLGIPNPITYLMLCETIEAKQSDISAEYKRSQYSKSTPQSTPNSGRAFAPALSLGELIELRAEMRATGRFILKADISNFYHSIYTHSIPWAIRTKPVAKRDKSSNHFGNELDKLSRNLQDQQTIGIPVGPDTSLLIAEIIGASIDAEIQNRQPNLRGFRYYDDFEFVFDSQGDAETALSIIESVLSIYELHLNPAKTKISKLPVRLENSWTTILRSLEIRDDGYGQRVDIINFFDNLFRLIEEHPFEHVVSFAIGRLIDLISKIEKWDLVFKLLCQAVTSQPNSLPEFYYFIAAGSIQNKVVNFSLLEELLNKLITVHAPLNHGSEVAWSLWGLCALNLRVHNQSVNAVGKVEDSIVAILSLAAKKAGILDSQLDTKKWESYMNLNDLRGEHWLLSYEANYHNFLSSSTVLDHVSQDSSFKMLKDNSVSFFSPPTQPFTLQDLEMWRPNPGDYK